MLLAISAALSVFRIQAAWRETVPWSQAAPAQGRHLATHAGAVFIEEAGPANGTPVLFVHGTGAWSEIWRPSMTILAHLGFRAIALDLPPFGFSEKSVAAQYRPQDQAKIIAAVLDALDISQVTLVGHSFGSRATVEVAMARPERVRALVLVDAALGLDAPSAPPPWIVRAVLELKPLRDAVVASTLTNPLLTRQLLQLLIKNPASATPALVTMLQQPLVIEHSTEILGNWLQTFTEAAMPSPSGDETAYTALRMPVLLIWGSEDTVTPLSQARHLLTLMPAAELTVLQGLGHIPHIEDTSAFNAALSGFLLRYRQHE